MAKQALKEKLERNKFHRDDINNNNNSSDLIHILIYDTIRFQHERSKTRVKERKGVIISPDFSRIWVFLTSGSVGVNVFEILFGLDTGQYADDGSGPDEENMFEVFHVFFSSRFVRYSMFGS